MSRARISPAFEPFLADSGPDDRREAIVIYRSPVKPAAALRGRLRELQTRLDFVKERAAAQKATESTLFRRYQGIRGKRLKAGGELAVTPLGSSVLPVATVEVTRTTLSALAKQPGVVAILPNQRVCLVGPKSVRYEGLQATRRGGGLAWGLEQLDIPSVWKRSKGADINVAVLDTGVHGEHPALKGRVKAFVVIDPLGRRVDASPAFDSAQHGTHVCGIIAGGKTPNGVSIGVAPEANLLVAAVLMGETTIRTVIEGISWAVEEGANVINMSLGFSYYEPLFAEVFQLLIDQYGILPVVAIGNENHGSTSSPGNVHNAFSVGAVERGASNGVAVAFFSSGASLVFPGKEPDALVTKPDVVAPGVEIFSCVPPQQRPEGTLEYAHMDGTSMAAPHVAGAAALIMAAKPELNVSQIIATLKETAYHPSGTRSRPDNRWGFGLIRPLEALKALT